MAPTALLCHRLWALVLAVLFLSTAAAAERIPQEDQIPTAQQRLTYDVGSASCAWYQQPLRGNITMERVEYANCAILRAHLSEQCQMFSVIDCSEVFSFPDNHITYNVTMHFNMGPPTSDTASWLSTKCVQDSIWLSTHIWGVTCSRYWKIE